jgi:DNA sulfur modification protein DndC
MTYINPLELISFFSKNTIQELYEEVRQTYKANNYPWVIGYSGGKDSTATTQIIWYALSEMRPEEWNKPIFIISSDTLVETPVVVDQINSTLRLISAKAKDLGLPILTQKVNPKVEDTFWVSLIGKGYPTPSKRFRWCTERMKIKPANSFIVEQAARFGEVVMVLGARKSEGMSRAQVLSNQTRQIAGTKLRRHSSLSRAYTYTPVEDFTTDDIWTYLLQVPSPWGSNNRDLAALYRRTESGECPLVVDTSTPSCGNSRFGCWVCTVVDKDKTMQTLIDTGEEWLEPLLDFRDMLKATQEPEKKLIYREFKRRDGQVMVRDDKFVPGPYKPEYRIHFLKELLRLQVQLRKEGPNPEITLITHAELYEIRRIWKKELPDLGDPIPYIYNDIVGENLNWTRDETGSISGEELEIIKKVCEKNSVPLRLVTKLIETEKRMEGMGRRAGIFGEISSIFQEEWANQEEILERIAVDKEYQMRLGLEL